MLFAGLFAFGVMIIFVGFAYTKKQSYKPKNTLERLDAMMDEDDEILTEKNFYKNLRSHGLEIAIAQADLDITVFGFVRSAILVAIGTFLAALAITGTPLVAGALSIVGVVGIVEWLSNRRDKKSLEYEEAIADIADRLAAGAELEGTLHGTVLHATRHAPEIMMSDMQLVASALSQNATVHEAFEPIQKRRRSYSLNLLIDALDTWSAQGTNVPLADVLRPLTNTIRGMSDARRDMEAELSGVRTQMIITALAPLGFAAFLRSSMPEFKDNLTSSTGVLVQLVAYSIAAAGYKLGQSRLNTVRKVIDIRIGE